MGGRGWLMSSLDFSALILFIYSFYIYNPSQKQEKKGNKKSENKRDLKFTLCNVHLHATVAACTGTWNLNSLSPPRLKKALARKPPSRFSSSLILGQTE